ncbi:sodium-dependent phosphate transporter 1-like [Anneissia japonica]|uniref:sodium-dependent phosphate transporter 1-like n=1 Tax=Anneissia japonica TaxID=1529436 RepID=UPI0014256266|nr:sodium-dependent phosphate transporter 1-like [Anneissia japonica]
MDPVSGTLSAIAFTTIVTETTTVDIQIWLIVIGFILSFTLAVGLGANDVANSFATTVGAKVLTFFQVCILAAIFETAGAVLLGSKVSDTIRKGIFDVTLYEGQEDLLAIGQIAALSGAFVWLSIATWLSLPVSGTHSIVGAMLGFHLVAKGTYGINWKKFGLIVSSWFTSPFLSGIVSAIIYSLYRHFVLKKVNPLEPGLRVLPVCYGTIFLVNIFSITFGPSIIGLSMLPHWVPVVVSLGVSLVIALVVWVAAVPRLRKKYMRELVTESQNVEVVMEEKIRLSEEIVTKQPPEVECRNGSKDGKDVEVENGQIAIPEEPLNANGLQTLQVKTNSERCSLYQRLYTILHPAKKKALPEWLAIQDKPVIKKLCGPLQILSATFASFAHGGNDVSNAVSPFVALWLLHKTGEVSGTTSTPFWILFYGGCGISVGLWLFGRRVLETMGENLMPMTSSSGFTIELGAAMTVLTASNLGIPVSTTHCKVGSIIAIGLVQSRKQVDWNLFRNIIFAWIVTLPVTASVSAFIMYLLQFTL